MSRAFVKETDDGFELPDRPVSDHPNDVTVEGFTQIESALKEARKALAAAQSAGDRSAVAYASRDLRYWTTRRASARVVAPSGSKDCVRFGARVTIRRDDGREQTFRIVGEDEADPSRGTISHVAPMARALFGCTIGNVVRIGPSQAKILAIG